MQPGAVGGTGSRGAGGFALIEHWDYFLYGYDAPSGGIGMATTLPVDQERDIVAELRSVVEEITRKVVEVAPKQRIGFL